MCSTSTRLLRAASAALMELMTRREGLPDMLQAFKSYFLLARGDLFTTFLELAEAELERNAADVTVTRLQSLLELGEAHSGEDLLYPVHHLCTHQRRTICSLWSRIGALGLWSIFELGRNRLAGVVISCGTALLLM